MNEPGKLDVASTNKGLAERFSDLVDIAFVQFRETLAPNWNPFLQQENDKGEQELMYIENDEPSESGFKEENENCQNYSETLPSQVSTTILNNSEIADKIRSLSFNQRQIFDFIYSWVKSLIERKSAKPFK